MKFKFFIFFSLVITSPIIFFAFFFDSSEIKRIVQSEIAKKFDVNINFSEDISISIFPKPRIILKDFQIKENPNFYNVRIEKIFLYSDWSLIFAKNVKIKSIEIFRPVINIESLNNNILLLDKVNYNELNTFDKKLNRYLNYFDYLDVKEGKIFLQLNDLKKEIDFNLNVLNTEQKEISGKFKIQELDYLFDYKIKTQDFVKSKLELKYFFKDFSNSIQNIEIKGTMYFEKNKLAFDGDLNSGFIDLDRFIKDISIYMNKTQENFTNIKITKRNNFDFLININGNIDKTKYLSNLFRKSTFKIVVDRQKIFLKDLNSNYLNSTLEGNSEFSFKSKVLSGVLNLRDFNIPSQSKKNDKSFDVIGGKVNASVKFKSLLEENNKEFLQSLNADGIVNIEQLTIEGLNIDELINKLENLENISDIFFILNSFNKKGRTLVDSVKLKFSILDGFLYLDNCISEKKKLTVFSKGKYDLTNDYLELNNSIKFKIDLIKDLPDLKLSVRGQPDNLEVNYDLNEIKEKVFNQGLKKLMKENQDKLILNPADILKLFKEDKIKPKELIDELMN